MGVETVFLWTSRNGLIHYTSSIKKKEIVWLRYNTVYEVHGSIWEHDNNHNIAQFRKDDQFFVLSLYKWQKTIILIQTCGNTANATMLSFNHTFEILSEAVAVLVIKWMFIHMLIYVTPLWCKPFPVNFMVVHLEHHRGLSKILWHLFTWDLSLYFTFNIENGSFIWKDFLYM